MLQSIAESLSYLLVISHLGSMVIMVRVTVQIWFRARVLLRVRVGVKFGVRIRANVVGQN